MNWKLFSVNHRAPLLMALLLFFADDAQSAERGGVVSRFFTLLCRNQDIAGLDAIDRIKELQDKVYEYFIKNDKLPSSNKDIGLMKPHTFTSGYSVGWQYCFSYSAIIENGNIILTGDLAVIFQSNGHDELNAISFEPKIAGSNIGWLCKGFRVREEYEQNICTENME